MNEWVYKKSIPNIVIIFIFSVFFIWGVISCASSYYYKTKYRRTESELAEQFGTITDLTREAIEYVQREQDLLIESGNTIREIRAQVESLEAYSSSLEFYIYSIRDSCTNYDKGE